MLQRPPVRERTYWMKGPMEWGVLDNCRERITLPEGTHCSSLYILDGKGLGPERPEYEKLQAVVVPARIMRWPTAHADPIAEVRLNNDEMLYLIDDQFVPHGNGVVLERYLAAIRGGLVNWGHLSQLHNVRFITAFPLMVVPDCTKIVPYEHDDNVIDVYHTYRAVLVRNGQIAFLTDVGVDAFKEIPK